jgi:hypothetical protein
VTKRWRRSSTSVVLALVAGALAVWIWIDRGSVTDTERAMRPRNVFGVFRREELSRIEIAAGKDKLVVVRDLARDADASWQLQSPEVGLADPAAVDQLSSAFEFATYVRKVEPKAAPTFDAPRATGSLTMGKLVFSFALGGMAPAPEGAGYLRVDKEVYVVPKDFVDRLLTPASTYRSRTIVPYLSLDLASLDLHTKAHDIRIERWGQLTFKLAGTGLRASREHLDKLWSSLAELRAESFTDDAAIDDPVVTLTMTPKDGRPGSEIAVGGTCPNHPEDVLVTRKTPTPMSACAPRGVLEGLSQSADELVDTRLFFAHEDEVEELSLAAPGASIDLARKGSGWHARAPFDRDLSGDEVDAANSMLSAVIRSKGSNVASIPSGEPFTVRAHVKVKGGEMAEEERVDLGQGPHGWVVQRLADHARLDVTPELARKLQPSKSALKGRDVVVPPVEPREVRSLLLRCGTPQDLSRTDATWKLAAPRGFVADQAAALDLVEQVAHLRADVWEADADDGSFGFAGSTCSVSFGVSHEGGIRTVKLTLGREVESGVYAIVDDGGVPTPVFLEPRTLRDVLGHILVDRSSLSIDSAKAASIVLVRPGSRIELKRVADILVTKDGGAPTNLASLIGALDTLRADDVVHLGPPLSDEGFAAPSLEVLVDGKAVRFGRDVLRKNQVMVLARVVGVDATFAVARERIDPLRSAL